MISYHVPFLLVSLMSGNRIEVLSTELKSYSRVPIFECSYMILEKKNFNFN